MKNVVALRTAVARPALPEQFVADILTLAHHLSDKETHNIDGAVAVIAPVGHSSIVRYVQDGAHRLGTWRVYHRGISGRDMSRGNVLATALERLALESASLPPRVLIIDWPDRAEVLSALALTGTCVPNLDARVIQKEVSFPYAALWQCDLLEASSSVWAALLALVTHPEWAPTPAA